jgi:hypothetical protein
MTRKEINVMPYFTYDIQTAMNRAALYMSMDDHSPAVILYHPASKRFVVVASELYFSDLDHWHKAGHHLAMSLSQEQMDKLTGSVQLDLIAEDVYAVGTKDI